MTLPQNQHDVIGQQTYDPRVKPSFDFEAYEQDILVDFIRFSKGHRQPANLRQAKLAESINDIFSNNILDFDLNQNEECMQEILDGPRRVLFNVDEDP